MNSHIPTDTLMWRLHELRKTKWLVNSMTIQQFMTVSNNFNFTHVSIIETNLLLQLLIQQTLWFKELPGTNPNLENCRLVTEITHFDFRKKKSKIEEWNERHKPLNFLNYEHNVTNNQSSLDKTNR